MSTRRRYGKRKRRRILGTGTSQPNSIREFRHRREQEKLRQELEQLQEKERLAWKLTELEAAAPTMSIDELERLVKESSGAVYVRARQLLLDKCRKRIKALNYTKLAKFALEPDDDTLHSEARQRWLKDQIRALGVVRSYDVECLQELNKQQRDPNVRSLLDTVIKEKEALEENRTYEALCLQSIAQLRTMWKNECSPITKRVIRRLIREKEDDAQRQAKNQGKRPSKPRDEKRGRHFLAYWTPRSLDRQLPSACNLEHSASNQFKYVRPGDTVWLVTVRDGVLRLVTRIVVGLVTNQSGAADHFGCRLDDLWDATHHIISAAGAELPIYDRDIRHLAARLRFKSDAGHDRLNLTPDGAVNAQQLQTMRRLSPEAAEMLAEEIGIRHARKRSRMASPCRARYPNHGRVPRDPRSPR